MNGLVIVLIAIVLLAAVLALSGTRFPRVICLLSPPAMLQSAISRLLRAIPSSYI